MLTMGELLTFKHYFRDCETDHLVFSLTLTMLNAYEWRILLMEIEILPVPYFKLNHTRVQSYNYKAMFVSMKIVT